VTIPMLRHVLPAGTAALTIAALTAAPAAHAVEQPLWELGIGAGGLRLPHYRGADQSRSLVLPVPYVIYRGRILRADREGARAVLLETDRVDFDLSLAASPPARSRDNDARAGMGDLAPTVEFGPNLNWTFARGPGWKLDLRMPVRAAFTVESHPRSIGWIASPNVNLDLSLPGGWKLGLLAGPQIATKRFNAYTYDVAPDEATATRPAYASPGGFGGGRVLAAVSRRFAGGFAGAFVRVDSLHGAVFADSPLVRQRTNVSVGIAFAWVLATSPRRVESDN
jgi:outer membrane protein